MLPKKIQLFFDSEGIVDKLNEFVSLFRLLQIIFHGVGSEVLRAIWIVFGSDEISDNLFKVPFNGLEFQIF